MFTLPLGFIGSAHWTEVMVILAASLMIFGGRLPEVALRLVAQVMRARRAVSKMWRDTGLEDELRRVRRDIEDNIPRDVDFDVRPDRVNDARRAAERARLAAARDESADLGSDLGADREHDDTQESDPSSQFDASLDPDADRRETASQGSRSKQRSISIEPADGAIASGDDLGAEDSVAGDLVAGELGAGDVEVVEGESEETGATKRD